MDKEFKYDVAISFLQQDESLARQLFGILRERLSTFVYFDRQVDVAGTDGEQTFNRVFGQETRLVVVLHREAWGKTPWTRIEETAIRNRGYDEGYDFVTFIPLEKPPAVPQWLPKNRIWIGLDRWGVEGAALVVEARVQEVGGAPKEPTPLEQALRLERQRKADAERISRLHSLVGVSRADKEVDRLFTLLEKLAQEISARTSNIELRAKRMETRRFELRSPRVLVCLTWHLENASTLRESTLYIDLLNVNQFAKFKGEKPSALRQEEFDCDFALPDTYGWRKRDGDRRFLTTDGLADFCVKMLLDRLEKE